VSRCRVEFFDTFPALARDTLMQADPHTFFITASYRLEHASARVQESRGSVSIDLAHSCYSRPLGQKPEEEGSRECAP
jgi:hypothetical protein